MATEREKLDWLIDELGIDEEWLDHAATCDDCSLDLGWEYGGASKCLRDRLDHNELRPRSRWDSSNTYPAHTIEPVEEP